MFAWIQNFLGGSSRELSLAAEADHVELSDRHLILGLRIGWHNHTAAPISVKGLQVIAYMHGGKHEPLFLLPLERFSRVQTQTAIRKAPLELFELPAHEDHAEDVRFISKDVLDLSPGTYTVDVQIEDTSDVTHTNRTKIKVARTMKYRRSDEWDQGGAGNNT